MLGDTDLALTCIADEAANQPHEGRVAVAVVILNRLRLPYASDGTMAGTVLHKWAFSGFWAGMVHGVYKTLEFDLAGAETRAEELQQQFSAERALWADCAQSLQDAYAWRAGQPMSFLPGPAFRCLTTRTVLYYNPKLCPQPIWATPENQDAVIFDHTFFHSS